MKNRPIPPTPPPAEATPLSALAPATLPPRHHRIRWTVLGASFVVLVVILVGGWIAYRAISVINTKKADGTKIPFFQQFTHIITSGDQKIQGESDDRVNILLLGYGGPGHDGPYLTDTMMVMSYKPSTKQLALISIPRDLVVNIPGYDYRKINNVLSFGRDKKYPGGGEALTVKVVSDTLNIPIHYYARIDFTGFKEMIDQLKGVTVTVDRAFRDNAYPDSGIGYDPISFTAGTQIMNGERALKFARSRHGNNGEGSDFSRAKRQQKIIVAMKEKLLSFGTLSNPKKISDILGSLGSHSQTNMEVWEMLRLSKIVGDLNPDHIINKVYDNSDPGFLRAATGTGGAAILVPSDGTYEDMQFFARNIFLATAAEPEQASILVVNATAFTALGPSVSRGAAAMGMSIVKTTSLAGTTAGKTVLVSAHPGQHANTEKILRAYVHAVDTISISDWQKQTGDTSLASLLSSPVAKNTNSTVITNGHNVTTNTTVNVFPDLILVLGQDQPQPTTSTIFSSYTPAAATNTATAPTNTNSKSNNTNTANTNSAGTTNTTIKNQNTNTKSQVNTNVKSQITNTKSQTNSNSKVTNSNTKTTNSNSSVNKNTNSVTQ